MMLLKWRLFFWAFPEGRHIFLAPVGECQLCCTLRGVLGVLIFAASLLHAGVSAAADKPLWELGIGGAGGSFPAYRGASSQHTYALPFPFVIYRGERVKFDREGLRGELFESPRWRLELSADAMVPVDSEEGLRRGMPDLAPVLELGPSLEYLLQRDSESEWRLRLSLRSVLAVDEFKVSEQGWVFHPNLAFDTHNGSWETGASIGPLFASQRYHQYYYEVPTEYATATRETYRAEAGYGGMRFTIGASRYFGNFWLGAFLRYDDLRNAAFVDSPLVERSNALMGGVAMAWIFRRSSEMVER
jgi:MipA family protein